MFTKSFVPLLPKEISLKTKIILTCEHAGYEIPAFLKDKITISKEKLLSHEGWDAGAFEVCEHLQKQYKAKVFSNHTTRLVIDYNRNLKNKAIKASTQKLISQTELDRLISDYSKYRYKISKEVETALAKGQRLLVISVHSFTPIFKGKTRSTEIGILYRNQIEKEVLLAQNIKSNLSNTNFKIHFNRPYRGNTDCFLNDLLDQYVDNERVNGLFLEFNQKLLKKESSKKRLFEQITNILK